MGALKSKSSHGYYLNPGAPSGHHTGHRTGGNNRRSYDQDSNNSLSYDRQTYLRFVDAFHVICGTRGPFALWVSDNNNSSSNNTTTTSTSLDLYQQCGLVVKTKGSRLMRTATVVITDFGRLSNGKLISKSKALSATNGDGDDKSIRGPAEVSGALRVGDVLHSINGQVLYNKSRKQSLKMLASLIANGNFPIAVSWRHPTGVSVVEWENEKPMEPPGGEFWQDPHEFGQPRTSKYSILYICDDQQHPPFIRAATVADKVGKTGGVVTHDVSTIVNVLIPKKRDLHST